MKRTLSVVVALLFLIITGRAQTGDVGIGTTTPAASAALDVSSTSKGLLPPRMTWTQIQAIPAPAAGLVVYDITAAGLRLYNGSRWVLLAERQYDDLLSPPGAFGQVSSTIASMQIGGFKILADKSVLIAGYTQGAGLFAGTTVSASAGGFLAKLNADGTLAFFKSMPASQFSRFYDVETDASGNIYVCGYFSGTIDMNPDAGVQNFTATSGASAFDGIVAKYSPAGTYLWAAPFGAGNFEVAYALAVDATSVYVAGQFAGSVTIGGTPLTWAGGYDALVIKMSSTTGAVTWAKSYGSTSDDEAAAVSIYSGGGIVVGGNFAGTVSFGSVPLTSAGGADMFLAFVNTLGNVVNAYKIGGASSDEFSDLYTDAAGSIYVTGHYYGTANVALSGAAANLMSVGGADILFVKYSSSLGIQYATSVGGAGFDYNPRFDADAAGNMYVSMTSNSISFTAGGKTLSNLGSTDAYLMKISTTGAPQWLARAGSGVSDVSMPVGVSSDGKLLYSGMVYNTRPFLTFDGGRVNTGTGDYYMTRYEE